LRKETKELQKQLQAENSDEESKETRGGASNFELNADDLNWEEDDNKKGGKKKGKRGGAPSTVAQAAPQQSKKLPEEP